MDWIDAYMRETASMASPEIFRLWSAITAVAGALERRVSLTTSQSIIYPNLFTLLVAPPGVGKSQAIVPIASMWRNTRKLSVAPNSLTKAALVDAVARSKRIIVDGQNGPLEYSSLNIAADEFGVLLSAHDLTFLSALNDLYDCKDVFQEERRSIEEVIDIINPQINILAGTQPGFMSSLLPEEAWSMGFTSRLILVYSNVTPHLDLFGTPYRRATEGRHKLQVALTAMTDLIGGFTVDAEARAFITSWYEGGCKPVPDHSRLAHYIIRRVFYTLKLAMISSASRADPDLTINLFDSKRALGWLLGAEETMPGIFREMPGKNDLQLLNELHLYLWQLWSRVRKPLPDKLLYEFLSSRIPSDRIKQLIEVAEKSGILTRDRQSPELGWIPKIKVT